MFNPCGFRDRARESLVKENEKTSKVALLRLPLPSQTPFSAGGRCPFLPLSFLGVVWESCLRAI